MKGERTEVRRWDTWTENKRGQWVPAIPLPLYVLGKKRCRCGRSFWTTEGYRAHCALRHIVDPEEVDTNAG